ncbi:MAG TPA: hypothetical protein VGG74_15125 [Kofleriaceae bacterium]|jgi:hypothetical protein
MRLVAVVLALVACKSAKQGPADASSCVPSGPYDIPPDCDDADCEGIVCDTTCPMGQTCPLLDCKGSPQCRLDCQGSATCTYIDCDDSGDCFIDCHDPGSTCEVSCIGARGCNVACDSGECVLHCGSGSASTCSYDSCTGGSGITDCGSGVLACNRPCP